jgi:hypothetical protein
MARPAARTWLFLGLLLAIQTGLTLLDATPRFGDSGSYLWSAYHGGPTDRSWTYAAWFLRPILSFHSLNTIVYVQCALGVIPAWLAFGLVSPGNHRRPNVIAFAAACAVLIEPLALTYQRFVLADSLGLVMAASAVFLCVRVIDRSAGATAYAALAPLFIVLAASLRTSQVPSLALLCVFMLALLFLFYRDYRRGAALLISLVVCQAVFSRYAIENQGAPGYNAASGRYLLGAVLPIVSRDDVQPYVDPLKTPAILDEAARNPRARPNEMFAPGLAADEIQQVTETLKEESRLSSQIAVHAMIRDPIGFLGLAWSTYLDYFDEPFIRGKVAVNAGNGEFDADDLKNLAEHQLYGELNTAEVQSPVRGYFEDAWWYYGSIPAVSAILVIASLIVDRRLSTLTLAAFGLVSAGSHIAFSTEPIPRYLIVSAWVNIVVAGRIACVLATRLSRSEANRSATVPGGA